MNRILNNLNKIIYHLEENKNYKEAYDLQKVFVKLSQVNNNWFDKINIFKKKPKTYLLDKELIEYFQQNYPDLLKSILNAMGSENYKIVDINKYDDNGKEIK